MLKRIAFGLLMVCVLGAFSTAMAKQTPLERVKEGSEKLIKILSDPKWQEQSEHDHAIAVLRKTAEQYIDFRLVTMYSVGKPWLKMTKQMQGDLTESFVQLLERSYLQRIPAYSGQAVDYKKEIVKGRKAKVITELVDKDKKIVVEFRLQDTGKAWMIYDVVAEGVSLVANYRSQFSQILSDGSPEDLLNTINNRIDKLEKGESIEDDKS